MFRTTFQRLRQLRRDLCVHQRAGFTMVELAITMLISAIAIAATYSMVSSSSQVFHHQQLTADNQNNLRFATEMIKLDVARAGFNSTPNSATDPLVCPRPSFNVPAINVIWSSLSVPAVGATISYDQLLVVGDFSGRPPLRINTISDTRNFTVSLASLGDPSTVNLLDAATLPSATEASAVLEAMVKPQQLVRVTNPDGISQFARVQGVQSNLTVGLLTDLAQASAGNPCGYVGTGGETHEVHPVSAVLYRLVIDPNDPTKTNLVRSDYDLATQSVIRNTDLLIAEYVVDFDVLPITATPGVTGVPFETGQNIMELSASESVLDAINAQAQRIRFLTFRISTRTQRAIPERLAIPDSLTNAAGNEFLYFPLENNTFAEVRSMHLKVEVPNLILRNLQ